jgi:hypothetical protein
MTLLVQAADEFAQTVVEQILKAVAQPSSNGHLAYNLPQLDRPVSVRSVDNLTCKRPFAFDHNKSSDQPILELLLDRQRINHISSQRQPLLNLLQSDPLLQHQLKQHPGRGSTAAFGSLSRSGRVLTNGHRPIDITPNTVIAQTTGYRDLVTHYGTSWGGANTFEWLQTLKVAAAFGTPAVFENYEAGTNVHFYASRAMTPSFNMLDVQLCAEDLGWLPNGKFTQAMDPTLISNHFGQVGLAITNLATQAATDQTIAGWYRTAMQELGQRFLKLVDQSVPTCLISFESLLQQTAYWQMPATHLAKLVQHHAGHPVSLLHHPTGQIIRTDSCWQTHTIAQLHRQGYWLGGAAIYWISYSLGQHGSILQPVSDGAQGNVHLLAKTHLASPSQLWLVPINLIWMPAKGQIEDGCIDPWVLLELFERWGEPRSRQIAQQLWDLMEVPLKVEHIGRKTIATLSLNGLEVTIEE